MKTLIAILFMFMVLLSNAQSPLGTWATVDDITGKVKSHVLIFEKSKKLYASITKIMVPPAVDRCTSCTGAKKDKPLIGLVIMEDMKKNGDEWSGGTITDPKNGKIYKCKICLEPDDRLKVRGYIGFSLLGRTQYWVRVKP
jgi:uncharacterized protein (DUF2147 family)